MTRALTATITAMCIASFLNLPALADDGTTNGAGATTVEAQSASDSGKSALIADTSGTDATTTDADGLKKSIADATPDPKAKKAPKAPKAPKAKKDPKPKKDPAAKADPTAKKDAGKDSKDDATKSASGGKGAKKASTVALPVRLASFTTGVVFGTPVAIVRRYGSEFKQGEHDLCGDPDSMLKKAAWVFPGGFLSAGFSAVSGGIGGCLYSVKNAWTGSGEEPFGKDTFSLGDNMN